ncbi:hypothetical protein CEUSTIGMA_g1206.t1 [Chlamydomonas eustigma]|uniref:Pherophorin domain-containing protein n=1 Tax=Chlamydomonas eustigma TaxID=1157962 RepID=A0A250WSE3_9CHLO|nr:hypothetical protein CEUSTIGMA_g1206.t1 [Chlamydomonas eustigma]|eukprot:GAX73755.1 hypothetical protein CEUSTIGMA_g1206.t1 [Chlamydomonas eustigma]
MTSMKMLMIFVVSGVCSLLLRLSSACNEKPNASNLNVYASNASASNGTTGSSSTTSTYVICYTVSNTATCNTSSTCCGSSTAKSVTIFYRKACEANITAITVNNNKWQNFTIGPAKRFPAVTIKDLPTKTTANKQEVCLSIKTATCSTAAHFSGGASIMSSDNNCCPRIRFSISKASSPSPSTLPAGLSPHLYSRPPRHAPPKHHPQKVSSHHPYSPSPVYPPSLSPVSLLVSTPSPLLIISQSPPAMHDPTPLA